MSFNRPNCTLYLLYLFVPGYEFSDFKPLFCQSYHIGFVSKKVEHELLDFQDVFSICEQKIDICPGLKSYDEISEKIAYVLERLRKKDVFKPLQGWRNETFDIRQSMGKIPLFAMERSATRLFGCLEYGVSINAYVVNDDKTTSVWLQRRALTKARHPGKLDLFVSTYKKVESGS